MCYLLDREGTEGDIALGGNRIPFGYKLEMPIDHPSGGVKEADFKWLFFAGAAEDIGRTQPVLS